MFDYPSPIHPYLFYPSPVAVFWLVHCQQISNLHLSLFSFFFTFILFSVFVTCPPPSDVVALSIEANHFGEVEVPLKRIRGKDTEISIYVDIR